MYSLHSLSFLGRRDYKFAEKMDFNAHWRVWASSRFVPINIWSKNFMTYLEAAESIWEINRASPQFLYMWKKPTFHKSIILNCSLNTLVQFVFFIKNHFFTFLQKTGQVLIDSVRRNEIIFPFICSPIFTKINSKRTTTNKRGAKKFCSLLKAVNILLLGGIFRHRIDR